MLLHCKCRSANLFWFPCLNHGDINASITFSVCVCDSSKTYGLYSLKILLVDISDVLFTDLLPFVMFNLSDAEIPNNSQAILSLSLQERIM